MSCHVSQAHIFMKIIITFNFDIYSIINVSTVITWYVSVKSIAINWDKTIYYTHGLNAFARVRCDSRLFAWTYNLFFPRPRFLSRQLFRDILSSLCARKKIACRIGAEQNHGGARSSRVKNNGRTKKRGSSARATATGSWSVLVRLAMR